MIEEPFEIKPDEVGLRIEVLCAKKFPQISRTQWQKQGKFICDGIEKIGKTKVQEGEVWKISCLQERLQTVPYVESWDFPLKILKESKTWVAIEKPEGISVHPSTSERTNQTIVNALVHQFGEQLSSFPECDKDGFETHPYKEQCRERFKTVPHAFRPGIVHRLDKVTSGVLLVAKTNATHRYLQEHWKQVTKTYYAMEENADLRSLPNKGKIEAGITRHHQDRQKMTVSKDEKAKDAETYFEVVETRFIASKNVSLLKITIPTGRTHQIRVHLSAIGHPILGDVKYGGSPADRVYLHAERLEFPNPDQAGKQTIVCSELPFVFKA